MSSKLKEYKDDCKILSVKIKESERLREGMGMEMDQTKDVMDKLGGERIALTKEIQKNKERVKSLNMKVSNFVQFQSRLALTLS